jgi:branched-chain amino acid transport system substrate-binding protein
LNANGGIHGRPLSVLALDDELADILPGPHAETLVQDPSVLAMIGPYASGQSIHAVPITSAAGLLHCSPTNTDPALTKPRYGALDMRGPDPERVSFIRIPPADDIQSKALATYAFVDLGSRHVLVIDEGNIGVQLADLFAEEFESLGGRITKRTLNEGADATALLEPVFAGNELPDAVFFSGATWGGAPQIRQAMAELGHGDMPMLAWDAVLDGGGDDSESYIGSVGADLAEGTVVSSASLPDPKFDFVQKYRARYGIEPEQWAAGAYACAEIMAEAIRQTADQDMTSAQLREQARAYAVDEQRQYETALGNIGFDKNGDNVRQFVGIYRVDPSAADGLGDWALVKKQDYGPAP